MHIDDHRLLTLHDIVSKEYSVGRLNIHILQTPDNTTSTTATQQDPSTKYGSVSTIEAICSPQVGKRIATPLDLLPQSLLQFRLEDVVGTTGSPSSNVVSTGRGD